MGRIEAGRSAEKGENLNIVREEGKEGGLSVSFGRAVALFGYHENIMEGVMGEVGKVPRKSEKKGGAIIIFLFLVPG